MSGMMGKVLAFLLVAAPLHAFAKPYDSYGDLLKAFYKAGFTQIVELDGADNYSPDLRIHTPSDADKDAWEPKGTGMRHYADATHSYERVLSLDYVESGGPLNYGVAEAYKLAEIFLCYRLNSNPLRNAVWGHKYLKCLLFPIRIDDVLAAVEQANKPKFNSSGR